MSVRMQPPAETKRRWRVRPRWHPALEIDTVIAAYTESQATEWFGCAGVKIRQSESLCVIPARARDEGRGTLREGTLCGSD
jgi:hypothetical protein